MKELSVVITVMNEEENIKPLLEAVRAALSGIDYEVILVDDGSADKTKQQVLEYADERTILVELRKNYGQSTAMTAGIDIPAENMWHCLTETCRMTPLIFRRCWNY